MHPSRGRAANEGGHLTGFDAHCKTQCAQPCRQFSLMPTITALGVPHATLAPVWLFLQIIVAIFDGATGVAGFAGAGGGGVARGSQAASDMNERIIKTEAWRRNMESPINAAIEPCRRRAWRQIPAPLSKVAMATS